MGDQKIAPDDLIPEDCAPGFTPQRGTGQGDVMSPECWAAVFDILLTALELDEEATGTTWVGADANAGYKRRDTAYADDLLSTTRDEGHLQRKADVVSAFYSIMGFTDFYNETTTIHSRHAWTERRLRKRRHHCTHVPMGVGANPQADR